MKIEVYPASTAQGKLYFTEQPTLPQDDPFVLMIGSRHRRVVHFFSGAGNRIVTLPAPTSPGAWARFLIN